MVSGIERSIIALDLDSQGQFIALTNAIEMQLETGAPVAEVVNLLGDALLALARERRLHQAKRKDLTGGYQPSTSASTPRLARVQDAKHVHMEEGPCANSSCGT